MLLRSRSQFFIFDDVKWATDQEYTFLKIDSEEGAYNTGTEMEGGNMGHRPKDKGGYFPVPPVDSPPTLGQRWYQQ